MHLNPSNPFLQTEYLLIYLNKAYNIDKEKKNFEKYSLVRIYTINVHSIKKKDSGAMSKRAVIELKKHVIAKENVFR